jgi:predicted enzyme related to lactoylglutathione lyase
MIQSLYSVAIFVNNLERAIEFYRDALGLPLRSQGSFGAEFLEGETRIGIHPAVHPDSKALVGRHTGLTFQVDGLLHLCGDLHARGVRFLNEPTQQSWGIMAMIADPDGNAMALWEPPPAEPKAGPA